MHKYRREKAEAEAETDRRNLEIAGIMVKWCVPLFWLLIVLEVVGILESIFENTPPVPYVLNGIRILLSLVEAIFLVKLHPMADLYAKAALYTLLTGIYSGISGFLPPDSISLGLAFIINLPGTILSCFAIYHTYNAHADAVIMADCELADKWRHLGIWAVLALAIVFMPFPITMLTFMITIIICGVLELVYLHRMIEVFRWYLDGD